MCGRFTLRAPADPIAYVLSLNLKRRQLSTSQRAMVGDKARELYDRQAKERQLSHLKKGNEKPVVDNLSQREGKSRDQAGAAVGVSGMTVDRARKVRRQGIPELIAAVEDGRMSVNAAAEVADLSDDVQRDEAKPPAIQSRRCLWLRRVGCQCPVSAADVASSFVQVIESAHFV